MHMPEECKGVNLSPRSAKGSIYPHNRDWGANTLGWQCSSIPTHSRPSLVNNSFVSIVPRGTDECLLYIYSCFRRITMISTFPVVQAYSDPSKSIPPNRIRFSSDNVTTSHKLMKSPTAYFVWCLVMIKVQHKRLTFSHWSHFRTDLIWHIPIE